MEVSDKNETCDTSLFYLFFHGSLIESLRYSCHSFVSFVFWVTAIVHHFEALRVEN